MSAREPRRWLEQLATVVIVLAAVTVAAASLHREFVGSKGARPAGPSFGPPTFVANWESIATSGTPIGNPAVKVRIIEFADLECPFCRAFHLRVDSLPSHVRRDVALVFIHYPLPYHRFALPSARALECAGAQGRFGEFLDAVYARQDSLGLKTWTAFAMAAGVSDQSAFSRCASDTAEIVKVKVGRDVGDRLGVRGTPTVIVNGWRFPTAPDLPHLADAIERLLAGRSPAQVR